MAATPVVFEKNVVNVSLSIGVAAAEHGEGLLPVLARADLALYDAKRAGRACVRQFAGDSSVRGSERRQPQRSRAKHSPRMSPHIWSFSGARRNPSRS